METFTKVKRYFIGVQLNIKICKQQSERETIKMVNKNKIRWILLYGVSMTMNVDRR